jgi:hypothetical protein
VIAPPVIHDGTRPVESHTSGPGRHSHAYPEGSNVALCGHTHGPDPQPGVSPKCPTCVRESQRRSWVAR